ncbi:MAG: YIP1 family protein [Ignavibacteria bacterium]|nr:YIP1 family protein [Ignavibacteria bacterium]
MDEITTNEPESNDNVPEEQASLFSGFIDIFSAPWEIGRRAIRSPLKVVLFAILLEALSITAVSYFYSTSPGIRKESYQMQAKMIDKMAQSPNFPKEKLPEQYENIEKQLDFNPTRSLGMGILTGGAVIFGLGFLLWISHRIFTSDPINYMHLLALLSYATSISFVGNIIGALMQFFGDSMRIAPGLGFLAPADDVGLLSLLSRINIFTIWYYAAVGIAIASAAALPKNTGIIISGIVYTFTMLVLWGIMQLMSMIFG